MTRTGKGSLVALVATLAMLPASAALAASTLDQSQDPGGTATYAIANQALAQTFTAGLSGTLTHVELHLAERSIPAGDLLVQLQSVTSGTPDGGVLASGTILAADVGTNAAWVSVDLNATSVAGTQYAIVVSAMAAPADCGSTDCGYTWGIEYDDGSPSSVGYGGGRLYDAPSTTGPWSGVLGGTYDGAFRTYVDDGGSGETPTTTSLADDVTALNLAKGEKQLLGKLDGAQAAFDRGNVAGACRKMDQFIGLVQGHLADGTIDSEAGNGLLADAESVKVDFGCDTLTAPGNRG
ncbi:MAG: hypothetical protein R3249_00175 [Nitriliruptorales bacterium]|nr:hypothetical protein [Nitriliruptorales bacterium]